MTLELPDKFIKSLEHPELMLDVAAGMYSAGHLTLAEASELARVSQGHFQKELGLRGIAANYGLEDLKQDVAALREITRG